MPSDKRPLGSNAETVSRALKVLTSHPLVKDASMLPAPRIPIQEWVRDACRECDFMGKSWSCPPGVGSLDQAREVLKAFSRSVFVVFRTSDRPQLEKAVLELEASLRSSGFPRALGFFTSPCTACQSCSYPERCPRPDSCRPTGESWGMDLMESSVQAGLPIDLVKSGEDFSPVTLFLLE